MEYVLIGFGGFMGALARYALSRWVGLKWPGSFPLATFMINITGSLALGFLSASAASGGRLQMFTGSFAAIGFLGAFTTYSTFSFEIIALAETGKKQTAAIYLAASVILGLAAAFAGVLISGA